MVMGIRKKRGKGKEAAGGEGREGEREAFNFQGLAWSKGWGQCCIKAQGRRVFGSGEEASKEKAVPLAGQRLGAI